MSSKKNNNAAHELLTEVHRSAPKNRVDSALVVSEAVSAVTIVLNACRQSRFADVFRALIVESRKHAERCADGATKDAISMLIDESVRVLREKRLEMYSDRNYFVLGMFTANAHEYTEPYATLLDAARWFALYHDDDDKSFCEGALARATWLLVDSAYELTWIGAGPDSFERSSPGHALRVVSGESHAKDASRRIRATLETCLRLVN